MMAQAGRIASIPPTAGLTAWYRMSGNANDSVGSQHLTVTGATLTTDRKGAANAAYSFPSSFKLLKRTDFNRGSGLAIGISLWVYPTSYGAGYGSWIINNRNDSTGLNFQFFFSVNLDLFRMTFFSSSGTTNMFGVAKANIPLNTWTHIVITTEGTVGQNVNIYINRNLVVSGALTIDINNATDGAFALGNMAWTSWETGGQFFGKIDDVRIYNRLLSPSEVSKLYNE
jgi:hypothetical protein